MTWYDADDPPEPDYSEPESFVGTQVLAAVQVAVIVVLLLVVIGALAFW